MLFGSYDGINEDMHTESHGLDGSVVPPEHSRADDVPKEVREPPPEKKQLEAASTREQESKRRETRNRRQRHLRFIVLKKW